MIKTTHEKFVEIYGKVNGPEKLGFETVWMVGFTYRDLCDKYGKELEHTGRAKEMFNDINDVCRLVDARVKELGMPYKKAILETRETETDYGEYVGLYLNGEWICKCYKIFK